MCVPLAAEPKLPPPANFKVDFEKHVQPILAQKCHSCHGDEAQQSGLRLDKRQNAMRGGDYGPVIIPGKSAESKLIKRLAGGDGGLQMPPTGALPTEEIAILRAWIDQGADFRIEVQEEAPLKPLAPKVAAIISAVRGADTHAVEKLLAEDASLVKATDLAGSTPLHHAAGFGPLATVKLLLDKGADVMAKNKRKSTPLFWGIHDEEKVRLLLSRGDSLNVQQVDGRTPVYQAATMARTKVLRLLLEKGADPNIASANGQTPLMVASGRGDAEAMRLLIDKGAKVDVRNGAGSTALLAAAGNGNPAAVRLLLDKGADPNVATKKKEIALHGAASAGVAESVKMLLEQGVNVNARDDRGYTPLMYAAGSDTLPAGVAKMLLAKGADEKIMGEYETAQSLAGKRGDTEVARLLGVSEAGRRQGGVAPAAPGKGGRTIREAVQTALVMLEKQSHNFIRIGGCNSCHSQDLPSAAAGIARHRGLPAPKAIPQLPNAMNGSSAERLMDLNAVSVGSLGWELFDLGMNGAAPDFYTDGMIRLIKLMQTPEGNWRINESRRPPMNAGDLQTTALAVFALKHFSRPVEKAEAAKAIARAAAALENMLPANAQDRAFHLMGLAWSNAPAASIERAAKTLASEQHGDGGWGQMASMGSDAYATGQSLFALNASGKVTTSDPVYQKGVKYLLGTQATDGTWHVKTRSIWIQPYFETGFPYGQDQWISTAGTSWASMALSMAAEPRRVSQNLPGE
ncbi:MAG: ankyrin repeat domain-containing protein [Bryobacteraceae bacterium]